MNEKKAEDDFSVVVNAEEIKEKNYSFSAGQYFEIKIEYIDITAEEFASKMKGFEDNPTEMFAESAELEKKIKENLKNLENEVI